MGVSTVLVAVASAMLVLFGLAMAIDYRGLAVRVAVAIAGAIPKPYPANDRLWSVLPLSLGLGDLFLLVVGPFFSLAGAVDGILAVVIYFVVMMRLAWLYTPPDRRVLGPLFWTRRAAAIPLAAFFIHGAFLGTVMSI